MAVIPCGLQRIAADETKVAKLEALGAVANVVPLNVAHDVGLAAAGRAGAMATEHFERKIVLHAIAPDERKFVADDFGAGWFEAGRILHKRKLATVADRRYIINL